MGRANPPTDTTAPSAPSNLTASVISSSQINLAWTASTDAVGVTGYRVERCLGSTCSTFAQIGTPSSNSYSDTGLTAATTYRYRVRATDAAGNLSGYSAIANGITQPPADITPPVISSIVTSGIGSTSAAILWTTNEPANSFLDYGLTTTYGATLSDATLATSHSMVLTNLTPGTTYHYRVRSTDAAGNAALSSDRTFQTLAFTPQDVQGPAAVTDLAIPKRTSKELTLTWSAPLDNDPTGRAASYDIRYLINDSTIVANWATATTAPQTLTPKPAGQKESLTVSGLLPGTSYTFAIRSKDLSGNLSSISNAATIRLKAQAPKPKNLVAALGSVNLAWGLDPYPDGTLESAIFKSTAPFPNLAAPDVSLLLATTSQTTFSDAAVTAGQAYNYLIGSYADPNEYSDFALVSITIPSPIVTPPSGGGGGGGGGGGSYTPPPSSGGGGGGGGIVITPTPTPVPPTVTPPTAPIVPPSVSLPAIPLYFGMTNPAVRNLQEVLKQQGFLAPTTPATDFFGPLTYKAVIDFQRQNNLPATGYVGPLTLQKLKEIQGTLPPAPTPTPPPPAIPPRIIFTTNQNLSRGSKNNDVLVLQRFLTAQGLLDSINQTGFFGAITEQAVKTFQKQEGILVTGIVGPLTKAKIQELQGPALPPTPPSREVQIQSLLQQLQQLQKQLELLRR